MGFAHEGKSALTAAEFAATLQSGVGGVVPLITKMKVGAAGLPAYRTERTAFGLTFVQVYV